MALKDGKSSKNSTSFSLDNNPKVVSVGACPFLSKQYVFKFGAGGGQYVNVDCLASSACHLWSVRFGKCKLGLTEDLYIVMKHVDEILSVLR